jgi:ABC-type amino acid transport system permease subunit
MIPRILIALLWSAVFQKLVARLPFSPRAKRGASKWAYISAGGLCLGTRLPNDPFWAHMVVAFILWLLLGVLPAVLWAIWQTRAASVKATPDPPR